MSFWLLLVRSGWFQASEGIWGIWTSSANDDMDGVGNGRNGRGVCANDTGEMGNTDGEFGI